MTALSSGNFGAKTDRLREFTDALVPYISIYPTPRGDYCWSWLADAVLNADFCWRYVRGKPVSVQDVLEDAKSNCVGNETPADAVRRRLRYGSR